MKFINLQTLVYLCKLERSKENKFINDIEYDFYN